MSSATAVQHDLRQMSVSKRFFWAADLSSQLGLSAYDRDTVGQKRKLPLNETITLGLNEIASHHGKGFFLFAPNRDTWKTWPSQELHPLSRRPEAPRADFPAILFLNYLWSDTAKESFSNHSHRSRYLKSNSLIAGLAPGTPLFGIQFAASGRYPLYSTSVESLVLLVTLSEIFLIKTGELESITGRWPKRGKAKPAGPDPDRRLNTIPELWMAGEEMTPTQVSRRARLVQALGKYSCGSLEDAYSKIIGLCTSRALPASFDTEGFYKILPASRSPEAGIALGAFDVEDTD